MEANKSSRRSRDGCWTCRKRKKKCDSAKFPCQNCKRLGIECETDVRLVWEDDNRRQGMKRRGPPKLKSSARRSDFNTEQEDSKRMTRRASSDENTNRYAKCLSQRSNNSQVSILHKIPDWPFELDNTESSLLDHYIQRFSRTYPTFSGPTNPFLRVFIPLSMRSRAVLDALLALSGVQSWENGKFSLETKMLRLRGKALQACLHLLARLRGQPYSETGIPSGSWGSDIIMDAETISRNEETLYLLAACVLFILYEKLTGEGEKTGSPHLRFFAQIFPRNLIQMIALSSPSNDWKTSWSEELRFLAISFLYNDLVWSTSLKTPTLSDFYLAEEIDAINVPTQYDTQLDLDDTGGRFRYPNMILRLSTGDQSVTDASIASWDGRLDWFPSFALTSIDRRDTYFVRLPIEDPIYVQQHGFHDLSTFTSPWDWDEEVLVAELYRVAAAIHRRRCIQRLQWPQGQTRIPSTSILGVTDGGTGNLASWAIQLINLLPDGSPFENTLLWPIGIVAKELTWQDIDERHHIMTKLRTLERRFKMKIFYSVRKSLEASWSLNDVGIVYEDSEAILFG